VPKIQQSFDFKYFGIDRIPVYYQNYGKTLTLSILELIERSVVCHLTKFSFQNVSLENPQLASQSLSDQMTK